MISKRTFRFSLSKKAVSRSLYILLTSTLLALVLLTLTQPSQAAPSANLVIQTNVAEPNPTDGLCSLHEAITNHNVGARVYADCLAPNPAANTIDLAGLTITISTPLNPTSGYAISKFLTIEGNGGTIKHLDEGVCEGANGGISEFRLFTVGTGATLFISDTTLRQGCLKSANGGAIYVNAGGFLSLMNTTVTNNTAVKGGAIHNAYGTVRISNSTFTDNLATDDGGGIFNTGAITIASSTFYNNSATDNGGVLMTNAGSSAVAIVNSTLYGNTAGRWGGALIIGSGGGTMTLYDTTITENVATSNGGGLYRNTGTYDIRNSIISGNTSNDCAGTYSASSSAQNSVFGYSASSRGCTGFSSSSNVVIPTGALSTVLETSGGTAMLADNGGSTQTVALIAGSPAHNAGSNALRPNESDLGIDVDNDGNTGDNPIDNDQRGSGYARIGLSTVDAGAYEITCNGYSFPYTVGTVNSNLVDDLRVAVTCANVTAAHDTIDLNGQLMTFDYAPKTYDAIGHNALPKITESLTIQNGVLERNSGLTSCDGTGDRTEFRFLTATTPLLATPSTDVTVNDITFRNGCASDVTASGDDTYGGAILFDGNSLHVNNTHFEYNAATQFGGAIYTEADMVVVNSSFVNNSGSNTNSNGSIIEVIYGTTTATIVNSTISGNTSDHGIYNTTNATTRIINSTISGNSDVGVRRAGGSVIIRNTILSDNGGSNCTGRITSDYSYSDDGSCDFSDDNGADNATITLGPLTTHTNGTQYYPLLGGDPVNGGSNTLLPNESTLGIDVDGDGTANDIPIEADQRGAGYARIAYSIVDAGAYEALTLYDLTVVKDGTGGGTVTSDPAGIDCGANCTLSLAPTSVVMLTAVADSGSVFSGWSGACTGTGDCALAITEAKNVTATFAHLYAFEFTADAPGIAPGSSMTLTARTVPAISGLTINFNIAAGIGTLSTNSAVTDADGEATVIFSDTGGSQVVQVNAAIDGTTVTDLAYLFVAAAMMAVQQERSSGNPQATGDLLTDNVKIVKNGTGAPWVGTAEFLGDPCPGSSISAGAVGAYVDVLLEDPRDITDLTIISSYPDSSDEADYSLAWCDNGEWRPAIGATIDIDNNTMTFVATDSTTPSHAQLEGTPFVVSNNPALPVTLGWFLAERNSDVVAIGWQTTTETGTAGFNILAAVDGDKIQLNSELIPSAVIDSIEPTDYTFSAVTDATIFYLQELEIDGGVSEHGPFEVGVESGVNTPSGSVGMEPNLWLPIVVNSATSQ